MATGIETGTAVIANGATTSSAATIPTGKQLVAIITPAALTGTTMTLQFSADSSTYVPVYDESTSYSLTVSTSRMNVIKDSVAKGLIGGPTSSPTAVKVVSGSSEGASRNITLVFARVE